MTTVDRFRASDRDFNWARVGDVAMFAFWSVQGALTTTRAIQRFRNDDLLAGLHVSTVAVILFISAALFLLRGPAAKRSQGLWPKVVAAVGTWSIIGLTALPLTWRPDSILLVTTVGIVAAYGWVVWALLTLRRNLSIFPEARNLVRRGPYRLVRHPLYSAHIFCYVLIAVPRLSLWAVLIAVLGIAAEYKRALNEERLLSSVFPDYAEYARLTPRFLPRAPMLSRQNIQSKVAGARGG